eukprot:CAMPEP_0203881468 /NCGR_PEP_ID=MMETSP0359-20131031/25762_1 /ASSEMBLY_ACC=CAM_ASM_000338 /TAXON_ID=268821 /ORGANISM="Scrippsiella Hangoei, Strain SHTV-5" /LENGTH=114 /DNA_ID=CAMNT_0050801297 /DNA_START=78 /DNA_END=419 /DNA_ORIENTATION=-
MKADIDKSKCGRIFQLSDVDNNGFLDFAELNRLTVATSGGHLLRRKVFEDLCAELGCDADQGLDDAALLRSYIELGAGDLDEDLQALEKSVSGGSQPSAGPEATGVATATGTMA